MTVVASYGMVLCGAAGSSDELTHQAKYRGKIEKVKFGVPIDEAFAHDIPATLLVLLLKVNKEGPSKKDIWRAPGNQAQVRKLAHVMQSGRLVNIANYSVYTAASVIKKFLQKLPGGILGAESEELLLASVSRRDDADQTRQLFCRVFCALPRPSQHLLVLLFGTFRTVADAADARGNRMTPDALGISVAPSLFHSCYQERHKVKMDDVRRLRTASEVVALVIKSFGHCSLFPRESYEFYARITGRTLRVDQNWLFTFQYPSNAWSWKAAAAAVAAVAVRRSASLRHPGEVVLDATTTGQQHHPIRTTVATHRLARGSSVPTTAYGALRAFAVNEERKPETKKRRPRRSPTSDGTATTTDDDEYEDDDEEEDDDFDAEFDEEEEDGRNSCGF